MKTLVSSYTFLPATKQVVLTGYTNLALEGLLLITNVTNNTIIYNFANPSLGATITGNVVTLTYNTTTMNATDRLQIYYDDTSYSAASDETTVLLRRLLKLADSLATVDTAQRLRVTVDNWTSNSGTVMGRVYLVDTANQIVHNNNGNSFGSNIMYAVPDVWRTIDLARQAYNSSIRSNLTFS